LVSTVQFIALPLAASLAAGAAHAAAERPLADNIVPVVVSGGNPDLRNTPLVDVTVCNQRGKCKIVPNVIVDTGSTGLVLFRGAVEELDLGPVSFHARSVQPYTKWWKSGSKNVLGPLRWAKVGLGNVMTTQAIPVLVFDLPKRGEALPQGYAQVDGRWAMSLRSNGILGIGPQRVSENGYLFRQGAEWVDIGDYWPGELIGKQLANPIAHFPAPYNNGSVISMPEVDWRNGAKRVRGWLGLGIGKATEELFPSAIRVVSHDLDAKSAFPAMLAKREVRVNVRSGFSGSLLDLAHLGVPMHPSAGQLHDASAPMAIELAVPSGGGFTPLSRPLYVGPTLDYIESHRGCGALPMVTGWRGEPDATNVLGLPFYYGRVVATGLSGTVNPFARGAVTKAPFVAADDDDEDFEIVDAEPARIGAANGPAIIDDYLDRHERRHPAPKAPRAAVADEDFEVLSVSPNGFIAYTDSD
jgi:hypothetical protein